MTTIKTLEGKVYSVPDIIANWLDQNDYKIQFMCANSNISSGLPIIDVVVFETHEKIYVRQLLTKTYLEFYATSSTIDPRVYRIQSI